MAGFQYLNRPDYVGNAFDGLIAQQQGHEQRNAAQSMFDQQQRGQQDQQQSAVKQQQMKFLLDQYFKQPADVQTKLYASAPAELKQYLLDPGATAAMHTPTPDEQFHSMVTADSLKTFPTLPQSSRQQGTYQSAYGAAMPSESVKLTNAQDVTGNAQSWSPQVQQRQAIEDKRALDAAQSQIQLPESRSKITLQGAQTTDARAAAQEHLASAQEHAAKTKQLNTQNAVMGTPDQFNKLVDDVLHMRADPNMIIAMTRRFPEQAAALETAVTAKDPNFSMGDYGKRLKSLSSFSSGPDGRDVEYLNRLIQHADSSLGAIDELHNTSVPAFNYLYNKVAPNIGGTETAANLNKFNMNMGALATEFAKVARGAGSLSQQEIEHYLQGFSPSASPEAQKASVAKLMELSGAQLGEKIRKYNEASNGFGDIRKVVAPQTETVLKTKFPEVWQHVAGEVAQTPLRQPVSGSAQTSTSTAPPTAPASKSAPSKVLINDPRIDKFMRDNHITDKGQAIRILQQNGIIQ